MIALSVRLRFSVSVFLFVLTVSFTGGGVAQPLFEDVTSETIWTADPVHTIDNNTAAIGDYDNDGWPDIFMSDAFAPQMDLLRNSGNGHFANRLIQLPPDISPQWKGGGALFGDYDNDGDLDLYIPVGRFTNNADLNVLLRNDAGTFVDVTAAAGLTVGLATDNAIWLDYDRDGHLDLYLGNLAWAPVHHNRLYRSRGDGTFEDVTLAAGLDLDFVPDNDLLQGTNGGMAAGDFNDDGWPDLYVGVYEQPNRLFLNVDGVQFSEVTNREIADEGQAFGVAVGDIDNDGDLDIFQTGGGGEGSFRSVMLANLGGGQFLDVLEGVGLGALRENALAPSLADFDNDGDLDFLLGQFTSQPLLPAYFLNNGDGTFTDHSEASGFTTDVSNSAVMDYNLDGFLDVLFTAKGPDRPQLYRNAGNDNHWLRIELVGLISNRNGIGARLLATAAELRQVREILGGLGYIQEEYTAHFGLGNRTQVDTLEIRWPSGQVDVLTDVPVDQKIRVFEGRPDYHVFQPTTWSHNLPKSVTIGTALELAIEVRPARYENNAQILQVNADLSQLGGPAQIALNLTGEGVYSLTTQVNVAGPSGLKDVFITIDQETFLGPHWAELVETLEVQPAVLMQADLPIFTDGPEAGWRIETEGEVEIDLQAQAHAFQGTSALGLRASISQWSITFFPDAPIDVGSYETLRFSFRPEAIVIDGGAPSLLLWVNGNFYRRIGLIDGPFAPEGMNIDPELIEWQEMELPLKHFALREELESITLSAALTRPWFDRMSGTFFIDDIRLVPGDANTTVAEGYDDQQPQAFALDQNYPNPFNSGTMIRFALPQRQQVELAVYNMAGQKVVRLVEGFRAAGRYSVKWDGRDKNGRALASGLYFYRLQSGTKVETHKLLLLR